MSQFGRVIDLDRCTGCRACVAACQVENYGEQQTPWQVVISRQSGQYPDVHESYTPMGCMHCSDAPCQKVCEYIDIHAISTNEFGVVLVDQQKCIGCGYCEAVCPYGVPLFQSRRTTLYPDEDPTPYEQLAKQHAHPVQGHRTGKAQKCTFCWHKINQAMVDGKPEQVGKDPAYTPACDLVCPVDARVFGDLDDPNSEVSKRRAGQQAEPMKKAFGTRPKVYYVGSKGDLT